ncbi:hypothetical protein BT69DRAFT_971479 [Atractiella rhizophila]|nr:hypothetical protein BT69DRAFT_971479 [Atractiella rhizophila]
MSESTGSLSSLPPEILQEIVSLLYWNDTNLKRLSVISHAFYPLVMSLVMQSMNAKYLGHLIKHTRLCQFIKELDFDSTFDLDSEQVEALSLMSGLRKISISWAMELAESTFGRQIECVASICSAADIRIVSLAIQVTSNGWESPARQTLPQLSHFPFLEELLLYAFQVESTDALPCTLRKLSLRNVNIPHGLQHLSLESLSIVTPISPFTSNHMPSSLRHLSLDLTMPELDVFPVISVFTLLESLTLKLYYKTSLRDPTIYYHIPPSVTKLDLYFFADGTTALMHALLGGEEIEGLERRPTGPFIEPLKEAGLVDVRKRDKACLGLKTLIVRHQPGRWNDLVKMTEKRKGITLYMTT